MARKHPLHKTRNIGLMAHIDAGKTTTTERILYYTGTSHRMGEVDSGNTVMDWMELEQERGITITSAATTCFWRDFRINVIDTPGHVDFTAEVERSLRVLDGVIVIICAVGRVQPQSETVWRQADKYGVPRLVFVNKMDRMGADYDAAVAGIERTFRCVAAPVTIPIGAEAEFSGIIDLVEEEALFFDDLTFGAAVRRAPIPEELLPSVAKYRERLIEALSEVDETILDSFSNSAPTLKNEIRLLLRRGTVENKIVPVLCGSAFKNKGVQLLLDSICDYLPSPIDVPPAKGLDPVTGVPMERLPKDAEPFCGFIFKIIADPRVGTLAFCRVYSGKLSAGSYVLNAGKECRERVSRLLKIHANKYEDVANVYAGDITAIVGAKKVATGDTICDETAPILLEQITFPEPVVSVSVEPKTIRDKEKLSSSLRTLALEDPTFKIAYNSETGETIISGMGELHIEIVLDRLVREYNIDANIGRPRVSYRETVTKKVRAEGKIQRQTGGRGQFAHIWLEVEPGEPGSGVRFEDKTVGGVIPRQFVPAVERGVLSATQEGVLAGYPLIDINVALVDGAFHSVDSSEIAFTQAGKQGLQNAVNAADPVLLEPIFDLEITLPPDSVGEVTGNLQGRRGKVWSISSVNGVETVKAEVPLANMFGYATALRSFTKGRGNYTMQFDRYQMVPRSVQEEILKSCR
ncbi:MAG: elongation factor G [Candidatus Coatesbacteria bacterium]|nr:elongation factor G [Candidatus Coatesbacteria bacterium]